MSTGTHQTIHNMAERITQLEAELAQAKHKVTTLEWQNKGLQDANVGLQELPRDQTQWLEKLHSELQEARACIQHVENILRRHKQSSFLYVLSAALIVLGSYQDKTKPTKGEG